MERILLVEDEAAIAQSVAYSLNKEGFDVHTAADGLEGLSSFRTFAPDLIILDLMLPKLGGLDVCRTIRKESATPIIMLTAKSEEIDRVVGLELGADDYLPKPFSVRELVARVRAVLRRTAVPGPDEQACLQAGGISVDLARRSVIVDGQAVHLPLKQFEILRVLIANKDKVLSREDLFRQVWDTDSNYDTGSLDVHVHWLREKIEADPANPRHICTVRGVGYKFVGNSEH